MRLVNIHQFLAYHGNRQGIAVLGFQTNDVTQIHERYQSRHASLIQSYNEYNSEAFCTKVLQVYAYYQSTSDAGKIKIPDKGTILRFIQTENNDQAFCVLPGLIRWMQFSIPIPNQLIVTIGFQTSSTGRNVSTHLKIPLDSRRRCVQTVDPLQFCYLLNFALLFAG